MQGAAAASARKADVRLRKGAAAEVEQRDVTAAEGGQMCTCASEKATADAVAGALAAQHLIGQVGQPHVRGRGLPRPPLDPRFEYSVLTGQRDCQRALLRYHKQIVACWAALSPGELGAGVSGAIVQESWTAVQMKLARTGWRPNPNPKPLTPYHDHPRRWRLAQPLLTPGASTTAIATACSFTARSGAARGAAGGWWPCWRCALSRRVRRRGGKAKSCAYTCGSIAGAIGNCLGACGSGPSRRPEARCGGRASSLA